MRGLDAGRGGRDVSRHWLTGNSATGATIPYSGPHATMRSAKAVQQVITKENSRSKGASDENEEAVSAILSNAIP